MEESNLRLTRLVARHFIDIQGLRNVVVGAAFIPAVLIEDHTVGMLAIGLGILAAIWCMPIVDRYYAREFGRVTPRGQFWRYVLGGAWFIAMMADEQLAGWPSLLWLSIGGWSMWIVWDCWPVRRYYLLLVAISLFGAITHTRVPAAVPSNAWVAQTMTLFCAGLIVTGLADHILLARIMRRRNELAVETNDAESI